MMKKIAIYDMDKTITVRATYTDFLLFMARRIAPWRLVLLPIALFALAGYGLGLLDRSRLKELNFRLLLGRPKRTALQPALEAHADRVMARNIRPGALEQIRRDRDDGYMLVLATASFRLYVEAITQRLGFEHVIATGLEQDERGHIEPRISGENCYGPAKLAMIRDWMQAEGIDPAQCTFRCYSDHVSDVPMLELASAPVATNAHPPLREEAGMRGWQIVDWPAQG